MNTNILIVESEIYKRLLQEAQTQETMPEYTDAGPAGGAPYIFFHPELNLAAFTASNLIGPTAIFINQTRAEANSYLWTLGDGNTSTSAANPFAYTYSNTGSFLVSLQVTNSFLQQSSSANLPVTLSAPTVTAGFTLASSSVSASATISFVNTTTYNGQGTLAFTWSFGSGSLTSSVVNPSAIIFVNTAAYTASLAVTESSYNGTSLYTQSFKLS